MRVKVTLKFPPEIAPSQGTTISFEEPASQLPGQSLEDTWHLTRYMWEEGNYSCDCNKSLFARQRGFDCNELECGDTIELVSLERVDE